MDHSRIVVIGASVGGIEALQTIVRSLPADFPAPVLMVLHIGTNLSILPQILSRCGPLEALHARDGDALVPGRILIAPSDLHLLVEKDHVRLQRGPKEHHTRPAIDPLFRSAALSHRQYAIGVILTGMLNDGTAGLQAIKEYGGAAIVQDPQQAIAPGMPRSALAHVAVDYCEPIERIPDVLLSLTSNREPIMNASSSDDRTLHEHSVFLGRGDYLQHLNAIGTPSAIACPECGGTLWEAGNTIPHRYRCHTGHAYTSQTLRAEQARSTDEALWAALRAVQEKHILCVQTAAELRMEGDDTGAWDLESMAENLVKQQSILRGFIETVRSEDSGAA